MDTKKQDTKSPGWELAVRQETPRAGGSPSGAAT